MNIDEYRQAIDNRDRIIEVREKKKPEWQKKKKSRIFVCFSFKQLEEAINEVTVRLRTPFILMLPSQSSTRTDEVCQIDFDYFFSL